MKGKFTYKLVAPSGYEAEGEADITPEQYGAICKAIEGVATPVAAAEPSDEQILDCFSRTKADGQGAYMIAVGRTILALTDRRDPYRDGGSQVTFKLPEPPKPYIWLVSGYAYYTEDKAKFAARMLCMNAGESLPVTPLYLSHFSDQVLAAYEQGKAENAKDAERLDFLQHTLSSLYTCTHTLRKPSTAGLDIFEETCVFDGRAVGMNGQEKLTVREAIDDAMEESASQDKP